QGQVPGRLGRGLRARREVITVEIVQLRVVEAVPELVLAADLMRHPDRLRPVQDSPRVRLTPLTAVVHGLTSALRRRRRLVRLEVDVELLAIAPVATHGPEVPQFVLLDRSANHRIEIE